jgi:hypothetical protein
MLQLPVGTAGFYLRKRAILPSLRMAGDTCIAEIALTKASSFCLSIILWQELLTPLSTRLLTGW